MTLLHYARRPTEVPDARFADALPRTLEGFRDLHAGEVMIVCGCGVSLNDFHQPERYLTIGVNDVGRRFDPTYLVVLNDRRSFVGERFHHVKASRAQALFSQLHLDVRHPRLIRIRLGTRGGTDFADARGLPYTRNSPYVAVVLAAFMGAKRIGLIGVDFTDDHFFAATGIHPLSRELAQIDREYGRLHRALAEHGIDLVNLSPISRLNSLPKASLQTLVPEDSAARLTLVEARKTAAKEAGTEDTVPDRRRVFFVDYRFLSAGDVFTAGLRHAAKDLGVMPDGAYWDDPDLPRKLECFDPDLLFVVHGRRFVQRWGGRFKRCNSAVWLLDEPYEVDDTARWSGRFGTVFVNDPSTFDRHRNAHYLPAAYDPHVHYSAEKPPMYEVGFVGGHNRQRERMLLGLLDHGLLSYVVGGPWRDPRLRELCLSNNLPHRQVADLYRQTRIVINVFREQHHYNRARLVGQSLNPRVYEALACGALVVSEFREEAASLFPEMPTFRSQADLIDVISRLAAEPRECDRIGAVCRRQLQGHSYSDRLKRVLSLVDRAAPSNETAPAERTARPTATVLRLTATRQPPEIPGWLDCGGVAECDGEIISLAKPLDDQAGGELGLASRDRFVDCELSFDLYLDADAHFIAKINQQDCVNQHSNSYHLLCRPSEGYVARHNHVLGHLEVTRETWQSIRLRRQGRDLTVFLDGVPVCRVQDTALGSGYGFVGIRGGRARLRNLELKQVATEEPAGFAIVHAFSKVFQPTVSIVTTVYDRIDCLDMCIESVQRLAYSDFEHIIVSDCPPLEMVQRITEIVVTRDDGRLLYANLSRRHQNWGIAPAEVGLKLVRSRYVCFLSDDNGYQPDHLEPLVAALDQYPELGFVYSSCDYAGVKVLRPSRPRPAQIDLGQPLFRTELFDRHLAGGLPFDMYAWDWHMIETFMRRGERWRHFDRPTFQFRLKECRRRRRI